MDSACTSSRMRSPSAAYTSWWRWMRLLPAKAADTTSAWKCWPSPTTSPRSQARAARVLAWMLSGVTMRSACGFWRQQPGHAVELRQALQVRRQPLERERALALLRLAHPGEQHREQRRVPFRDFAQVDPAHPGGERPARLLEQLRGRRQRRRAADVA